MKTLCSIPMPRGSTCGRREGHAGDHRSVESVARETERLRIDPNAAARKAAWYENLTGVEYNKRLLGNRRYLAIRRRRRRETK